jgi:hypothetical protein
VGQRLTRRILRLGERFAPVGNDKTAKMIGMPRPTIYTAERGEAIERVLAQGAPLTVAAAAANVSSRTVSRWLHEGLVVRRSLSAVQDTGAADIPDNDEAIQRELVGIVMHAAETDWRAARWLLEERWPGRYRR